MAQLGGVCVDCDNSDERVLQFDHMDPSTKARNISALMTRIDMLDPTLELEMRKCVIRCANCHIIKSLANGELGRKRKY